MKLSTILFITFSFIGIAIGDEKLPDQSKAICNSDLSFKAYANKNESGIGKVTKIRVYYESKSTPPSRMYPVLLLGEDDKIVPLKDGSRGVWLVGFDHKLAQMEAGKKYEVEGLLVEDQGYYGALVVYARSIKEISESGPRD